MLWPSIRALRSISFWVSYLRYLNSSSKNLLLSSYNLWESQNSWILDLQFLQVAFLELPLMLICLPSLLIFLLKFKIVLCLFIDLWCIWGCTCAPACMWRAEDCLWCEWILSFCHVGSKNRTQVVRIGGQCLYLLNQSVLPSPPKI